jgi:transposase
LEDVFISKPILAVGIDPAKRVHRAVGVLFPDEIVFDGELPNALDAIQSLDLRLAELAATHAAELVYGLEDHRRYGRLLCQVLTERGRDVRVVNPLWTNRQRAFYGQDKDDAIDGRSIAAVVLRRRGQLPLANDFGEIAQAIREAERAIAELGKKRTELVNRLHLQLSDVYTSAYETYFGKLKCSNRRSPYASSAVSHSRRILAARMRYC